jgi:hypothetical protein
VPEKKVLPHKIKGFFQHSFSSPVESTFVQDFKCGGCSYFLNNFFYLNILK